MARPRNGDSQGCDGRASDACAAPRRERRVGSQALLIGMLLALSLVAPIGTAAAHGRAPAVPGKLHIHKASIARFSRVASHWACPEGACTAIVAATPVLVHGAYEIPGTSVPLAGHGERGGLDPADLTSAYRIPTGGGASQTVALIDAYGYEYAEADLAKYRERYGLPPCTTANGCFRKVNERGEEGNYPPGEPEWDGEAALDEDMVSAACPECHILLVEGSTERPADLARSAATAAALGATEISNSYGYPELIEEICGASQCKQFNSDYKHAGVMDFAAAGDSGFEDSDFGPESEVPLTTNFPASSPNVVSVGGTELHKAAHTQRGWTEKVWNEGFAATGGGCSHEPKPEWQTDSGCAGRTDNDVAADASLESGVSVFLNGVWYVYGGTSVASPLVAGIEAHATSFARSLGAEAFYEDPSSLFDVTEGDSFNEFIVIERTEEFVEYEVVEGKCPLAGYLCYGELGYDGPTGLGTPDGAVQAVAPIVTGVSPDEGPAKGGTKIAVTGADFTGATEVKFGGTKARRFKVLSPTSISAVSPGGPAGAVNVTVATPGGTSSVSVKSTYTYR